MVKLLIMEEIVFITFSKFINLQLMQLILPFFTFSKADCSVQITYIQLFPAKLSVSCLFVNLIYNTGRGVHYNILPVVVYVQFDPAQFHSRLQILPIIICIKYHGYYKLNLGLFPLPFEVLIYDCYYFLITFKRCLESLESVLQLRK